jgi:hypothetical protein
MGNRLDAAVDDLANPYPKRFSQCYEPSKNLMKAIAAVDSKDWGWTLSSRGIANIWHEMDGQMAHNHAEADTPAEAMCLAFVRTCLTAKTHKCVHCGKAVLTFRQSCDVDKGLCEVRAPEGATDSIVKAGER